MLFIRGNAIYPLLSLDLKELDFGSIPVGFPTRKQITLINSTEVSINFSILIENDGIEPSLTCKELLLNDFNMPDNPNECQFSASNNTSDDHQSSVESYSSLVGEVHILETYYLYCIPNYIFPFWFRLRKNLVFLLLYYILLLDTLQS